MERFEELKGVNLKSDLSGLAEGELAGGQNMVKRGKRGMVRRPGFGAFDVESAAAVLHGSSITNARATFQPLEGSVYGVHDGKLTRYDGADSFDGVTLGLEDNRPTVAELSGSYLVASGGRVLLNDQDGYVPRPAGSILISDFEVASEWDNDGAEDGTTYKSGTKSVKMVSSVADTLHTTFSFQTAYNNKMGGWVTTRLGYVAAFSTNFLKLATRITPTDQEFDTVSVHVSNILGPPDTGNVTLEVRTYGATPDGVDSPVLATGGAIAVGSIAYGWNDFTLDSSLTLDGSTMVWIVLIIDAQSGGGDEYFKFRQSSNVGSWYSEKREDTGTWGNINNQDLYVKLSLSTGVTRDFYTGYDKTSTFVISLMADDQSLVVAGANTYIRFTDSDSNSVTRLITQAEVGDGAWGELSFTRDSVDDGTIDWSSISSVKIAVEVSAAAQINLDFFYLLDAYAPPTANRVFSADGRAFVASGNDVYYSAKYNPNKYYKDTVLSFPSTVMAVLNAGQYVLFLCEKGAYLGVPLSSFPDYRVGLLSLYGCVSASAACEVVYKGKTGAAWLTRNRGLVFWAGYGLPEPISDDIGEIFLDGGTNNQNMDYSRAEEVVMFWHPRYAELWVLYPTLFTGETNLKYGWVLDCDSGKWMPQFVWNDSNNLVHGTVYRDVNDSLYKILLTDSSGAVFHEGFVGSTALSATTSRDGYVDSSTTGGAIKGYVETGYVGGTRKDLTDKDQVFHRMNVKYIPNTTAAFSLDFDYRVANKGTGVDQDTYPGEEEVTFGSAWTSIGARSTTPANADDIKERNVMMPADVKGHAISVRAGQVDSGGAVEWELVGVSVSGAPRYGDR